jgi:alpha-D-ribose 1-methylphosphonate 5-triphosphate synthase subunit PhnH
MGHSCCYGERNELSEPGSLATEEEKIALADARAKLRFHLSAHNNPTNAAAGFASIQTDSSRMKVSIHDQDGEVLYTSEDIPPRHPLHW